MRRGLGCPSSCASKAIARYAAARAWTCRAYRIVQEALTNVLKHAGAGARDASSSGYGESGTLELEIADDGQGPVRRGRTRVTAS